MKKVSFALLASIICVGMASANDAMPAVEAKADMLFGKARDMMANLTAEQQECVKTKLDACGDMVLPDRAKVKEATEKKVVARGQDAAAPQRPEMDPAMKDAMECRVQVMKDCGIEMPKGPKSQQ